MLQQVVLACSFLLTSLIWAQPSTNSQLASYYYQTKEYEKAILYYETLYKDDPQKTYYKALLDCYVQLTSFKKAEKLVKQRIKGHSEDFLQLDLADVYAKSGEVKKQDQIYQDIFNDLPEDPSKIIEWATIFEKRNKIDQALKIYEKGSKKIKHTYPFHIEIAELYEKKEKYELMVKSYLDLLDINDSYLSQVQASLASSNGFVKGAKQNQILREALLKKTQKHPDKIMYTDLLIWLYLKEQNYKMALLQTKAIDKRLKEEGSRVFELARLCQKNKAYDQAIEGYLYLKEKDNLSALLEQKTKTALIQTQREKLIAMPNPPKEELEAIQKAYIDRLSEVSRSNDVFTLTKELSEIEAIYLSDFQKATTRLDDLVKSNKVSKTQKAELKIQLADYLILTDQIWDASLYYAQVEKDFKYDQIGEKAKFKNAKVAFYTSEFKWARAQLDVLKGSTSKLIANDAMWLSVLITDNLQNDSLEEPLQFFAKADLYTQQRKYTKAFAYLDSITAQYPSHNLEDEILFQKYTIERLQKSYENAAGYLKKIISEHPDDILADNALFKLAELYENHLHNKEEAKNNYFAILKNYPSSVLGVEARKRYRALKGEPLSD